jgi:hypothetical protein
LGEEAKNTQTIVEGHHVLLESRLAPQAVEPFVTRGAPRP